MGNYRLFDFAERRCGYSNIFERFVTEIMDLYGSLDSCNGLIEPLPACPAASYSHIMLNENPINNLTVWATTRLSCCLLLTHNAEREPH
jgi:hypothetical protein